MTRILAPVAIVNSITKQRFDDEVVVGETVGLFFIHKDIHGSGWTVTHRPTGYAATENLSTRSTARKFARFLLTLRSEKWWKGISSHEGIPKTTRKEIKRAIQQWKKSKKCR